ncbi:MAG: TGS domain-containing protein [Muribaculaceae bacterium]|nr:TGS domain-containing protein [Muribaculaceae bacterium]
MLETKNYIYPEEQQAPLSVIEKQQIQRDILAIARISDASFTSAERRKLYAQALMAPEALQRDRHFLSRALVASRTARLFAEMVEPDRNLLITILLSPATLGGGISMEQIKDDWGEDVAALIEGYGKVSEFASRGADVSQDNFRGLLLSLAGDIRIIIVMIAESLALMRLINNHPHNDWVRTVAFEANCLYAQLAHRLGLYKIKGELEDLSLKYTNREIYTNIARRLNETKRQRDAYIAAFIAPIKQKLQEAGLRFSIKGRTKSISSIWAKIKKQKVDLDHIYDLFAIRVIIDTPLEREKRDCWLAYSILADMYTANPARMRDWISIPKSNGYESLHATVMGPDNKWVEVQFRTVRMDLVAEKGMAAHWRYKGGHGDSTDQWMNNIRDILESADAGPMQLMRAMKMDAEKEIYAFTPKGDLFRLAPGSTVLDFAFHIHSRVGCQCTGAIVNSKHEKITYRIHNGDTVEILTSSNQTPKQDWLQYVTTTRARNKIRQALNEAKTRQADLGRELLERRLKNRKIEIEEQVLMKVIKKLGYKYTTDFFADIAEGTLELGRVINMCLPEESSDDATKRVGAEEFKIRQDKDIDSDVLVIGDKDIKGLNYKMARCCAPVYGDDVFGFISSDGVVKIHRHDCPNARNIKEKYPYRLISVRWSGNAGSHMSVVLKVVGTDDIGIVTNITSIINKEKNTQLRAISINSSEGLFQGILTIGIADRSTLTSLLKKIATVKGVKQVTRM